MTVSLLPAARSQTLSLVFIQQQIAARLESVQITRAVSISSRKLSIIIIIIIIVNLVVYKADSSLNLQLVFRQQPKTLYQNRRFKFSNNQRVQINYEAIHLHSYPARGLLGQRPARATENSSKSHQVNTNCLQSGPHQTGYC